MTVNPAALNGFVVAGFPSPTTAGVAGNFSVTAADAFGNLVPGYLGTVSFTSSDPQAALPASYAFVAGDNSTHTFSATLKTAGSQSITAKDSANNSGTQSAIQVNAAAPTGLALTGFPSPATAGVAANFTLAAKDPFGNTAPSYTGTVAFTSSDGSAVLPGSYTFVAGDNGTHTFIPPPSRRPRPNR